MNKNYNDYFLNLYNGKTLHQTERLIPSFSRLNSSTNENFTNTQNNSSDYINKKYENYFLDLYNGKTSHQTERLIPSFSRLNSS